ncbi:hypothetical protein GBA52_026079 [Prunus armeniaca]|nr:hypothetical protein GBA52_026079 [Prunus armeniaca]
MGFLELNQRNYVDGGCGRPELEHGWRMWPDCVAGGCSWAGNARDATGTLKFDDRAKAIWATLYYRWMELKGRTQPKLLEGLENCGWVWRSVPKGARGGGGGV